MTLEAQKKGESPLDADKLVIWDDIDSVKGEIAQLGLTDSTTVESRADGATVVAGRGTSLYANQRGVNLATQGEAEYLIGTGDEAMAGDPKKEEVKQALEGPALSTNKRLVPPGIAVPSRSYGQPEAPLAESDVPSKPKPPPSDAPPAPNPPAPPPAAAAKPAAPTKK